LREDWVLRVLVGFDFYFGFSVWVFWDGLVLIWFSSKGHGDKGVGMAGLL
jgi:hypothetical protein